MDQNQLNWITNFIWEIANVIRDYYVRGKYRDVILPMTVIRRLDAILEPTKQDVLQMKAMLDKEKITDQHGALIKASGKAFYNTSPFTLRDLRARSKQGQLKADFEAYLDGFSPNVKEILSKFEFHFQIRKLANADILGNLLEKFLDPTINLSDQPVLYADGSVRLEGLDNHGMGTIFEELLRKFNEENNEEAGEHFTPRDVVELMANLIFKPVADKIKSTTYLLYDGACGTGGMLTLAEETLQKLAEEQGKEVSIHLYGQEINPETYAIAKADLLLKGEGADVDHIVGGEDKSTLSNDAFPSLRFDFMLSNPPYGKDWKTDLDRMGGKENIKDPRFVVEHDGNPEYRMLTRSSDGQLMFLVNKLSKMKHDTPLGSRIAEVHNGSSLFTGDAGQGESNIRRWIIENDWLESIIALPTNMFYNTNIATYIWMLSNRKELRRKGKVQLIDATRWFKPRIKNLGKKNCDLSPDDIQLVINAYEEFKETEHSKIFPNEAFGYWKITVERPLRISVDLSDKAVSKIKENASDDVSNILNILSALQKRIGIGPHKDYNIFANLLLDEASNSGFKLSNKQLKLIQNVLGAKDSGAAPVIKKIKTCSLEDKERAKTVWGIFPLTLNGVDSIVEYEPDPDLRDGEQVPLLEDGGIEGFFNREILTYVPDAWINSSATKVGYEIPFSYYFFRSQGLRSLDQIIVDIKLMEQKTQGLLDQILGEAV